MRKKKINKIYSKAKAKDRQVSYIKNFFNSITIKRILYSFVCFLIAGLFTYYRDNIIKFFVDKKPRIIVNVTKVEPLDINKIQHMENFNLLFLTFSNQALIAAAKTGDKNYNKIYGRTYIPIPLIDFNSTKNYSISFKNVGDTFAKNITIDINSNNHINILEHDPKIKFINCGETPTNKSCHLEISTLDVGEEISFFTTNEEFEKGQFQLRIDGGIENVNLNFRSFKVFPYISSLTMELNGFKINFHPLNKEDTCKMYCWLSDNRWEELKFEL